VVSEFRCHSPNTVLITLGSAEARLFAGKIRAAVAVESVDLQNAGVARQVPVGMPDGPKADRRPDGKAVFSHIAGRGDRPTVTAARFAGSSAL
jgi:hypothetical protein